jgi:hypothetical protein
MARDEALSAAAAIAELGDELDDEIQEGAPSAQVLRTCERIRVLVGEVDRAVREARPS